jgi:hypothetical protein
MRRRLALIVALLLAGAIANVAVALGCALHREEFDRTPLATRINKASSAEFRALNSGNFTRNGHGFDIGTDLRVKQGTKGGRQETWYTSPVSALGGEGTLGDVFAVRIRSGWPCYGLEGFTGQVPHPSDDVWRTRQVRAWRKNPTDVQTWPDDVVPLWAVWPGFAINTIFYAAALWALFYTPGSVRRMIRRRRGLCPACAYPVGTSPVCTECGKSVRRTDMKA